MAELIFASNNCTNYLVRSREDEYQALCNKYLPIRIRQILDNLSSEEIFSLEEIRLRKEQPLFLRFCDSESMINVKGTRVSKIDHAYHVTEDDIARTLHLISQSSLYALEEEMRNGYITISGGHRVGFVGQTVLDKGRVKTIKNISSLNLRLAKQVYGCASKLMPLLYNYSASKPYNTLIVSPPRCGKTTLLRDIIRQFSSGFPSSLGALVRLNVGVVDERSEIAGCYLGVPQNDVGPQTDVLDGCPKAEGMIMLVRSMSPQIVATDEIGREEDVRAIEELLNCGVGVLTTVHGSSLKELEQRPILKQLIQSNIFDRFVFLGRTLGPGTIEMVLDGQTKNNLLPKPLKAAKKEVPIC
jgi:stage III sporulation protein AA